jgi:hypothetical protein
VKAVYIRTDGKLEWTLNTGYVGGTHKGEFYVDEDTNETEINDIVVDAAFNCLDLTWNEVEE